MSDYSIFKLNLRFKIASMTATFLGLSSTIYWGYEVARISYLKTRATKEGVGGSSSSP
ncbi:hypothetical protein [Candidatus Mycoplasma haematohominis]|uniref:hypothetical protein n=1 Tax=Candidatus Mycoplasma haematohominis TaxID=1494318 RepID=UPI001C0A70F2|nr:hypothetical protein [Candidatus Mycoplasma haemohominis]